MKTLTELITEALMVPKAVKPDVIAGRNYSGAMGFIEGKGSCAGVIIGQPFAMDDTAGEKAAAALANRDFTVKVSFDDLIKAIEKNKKGAYDEVIKKDKYKSMMYVYFATNKANEVYCCLYSDVNANLKGNYAYALKV